MYPSHLKYTREHEWISIEGDKAVIGITDYAQKALGDVVFVELPELERRVEAGEAFGVVESVKAVSDINAPCSGIITAVNEALLDSPELINQDPYGDGWIIEMEISELSEDLLSAEEYEDLIAREAE
ncbi:glycine cleavage system protein GcvH [Thermanaerosceptrum fracticalcis]|uniref:Glycine cleavage system H protein n=1 Tax=Thermanaerosceptrum fracticalcis TaxID=1712410 RepID=A0A7G6DZC2_THEFR|nr:glycine cleavage system protein GcvH [Thermanaerosceptrum fracticalcis]QNB45176.1 glycine cleavage system protein GcvH [Thermanaerosceptrum fracticalcis]